MTGLPHYCKTIITPRIISRQLSSIPSHLFHQSSDVIYVTKSSVLTNHTRIATERRPQFRNQTRCFTLPDTTTITKQTPVTPSYIPLTDILRQRVEDGLLVNDVAQGKVAKRLSNLQKALVGYNNEVIIAEVEESIRLRNEAERVDGKAVSDDGTRGNSSSESKTGRDNKIYESTSPGRHLKIATGQTKELDETKTATKPSTTLEPNTTGTKTPPPITTTTPVPRGLFLYGDVGTGKSYLMDIFYSAAPIPPAKKRRVHFHSFLQDVHQRIHELKRQDLEVNGRNFKIDTTMEHNPIYRVATQLASEVSLLCFDEFQVIDIADALILSQLFSVLFGRGTVVVATSNRPPSSLYEGGLNRSYFLPFIGVLERHCIVHDMNASLDYRRIGVLEEKDNFFFVKDPILQQRRNYVSTMTTGGTIRCPKYDKAFQNTWSDIEWQEMTFPIAFQRTLHIHETATITTTSGERTMVARFHFNDLCKSHNLGSSDFRAIAHQFDTVILEGIPLLTRREHDQARRFITLVDELYEAGCCLMCEASTVPDAIFDNGEDAEEAHRDEFGGGGVNKEEESVENVETEVGEALGIDVAQSNGLTVGGMASVRELSFAFRRAASRLTEMCSKPWWERQRGNK